MILYLAWFFASVLICLGTLKSSKKTQNAVVAVFLIALGIFVGLGDMLGGYDRYIYGELFDSMADVTHIGRNPWKSTSFAFYGSEFGYGTFSALMSFLTRNRYVFIFVLTIIIYVLLIRSITEYVDNAPFAVIMFMGLWFFFTFTYLRQVIGCTICWLTVRCIIKRDFKMFLLVWFIAFSFHNSTIMFLPMYFVPLRKFPREWVVYVMIGALLIGLSPIPQGMFATYGEIGTGRVNVEEYERDAGFRWAYLVEAVFFLYIILTNYRNISRTKKDIVMLNMALIFCAVLLVFVRSENGGRMGWMFMMGVFCTLTNICVKKKKLLQQGAFMIVVSFLLFYRILDSWSFNMCPYKTFLTPGHTAAEWIYEKYEYDRQYDLDKFHR